MRVDPLRADRARRDVAHTDEEPHGMASIEEDAIKGML
jgi:hypothetical protein